MDFLFLIPLPFIPLHLEIGIDYWLQIRLVRFISRFWLRK